MPVKEQRSDVTRRNIAGIFAIVLGLALGLFIRRIKIGLIVGIVLGFIVYSLLRKNAVR
jgi:hypothetical protein